MSRIELATASQVLLVLSTYYIMYRVSALRKRVGSRGKYSTRPAVHYLVDCVTTVYRMNSGPCVTMDVHCRLVKQ